LSPEHKAVFKLDRDFVEISEFKAYSEIVLQASRGLKHGWKKRAWVIPVT
jgi:hypothetical protein